ncbi:hypothetical protein ES705_36409 [subsurface metagenome]
MSEESYPRWLGRFMTNRLPRFLKNFVVGTLELLTSPFLELMMGFYGIVFGILGMVSGIFTSFQFFGLSRFRWGLVILGAFFLLTHGIYRDEKWRVGR